MLLLLTSGLVSGGAWAGHRYEAGRAAQELVANRQGGPEHPGARALMDPDDVPQSWDSEPVPSPDIARADGVSISE